METTTGIGTDADEVGHYIQTLNAAPSTITAAVVGVILNLSIWFSMHTVFAKVCEQHVYGARLLIPEWETIDPAAVVIASAAFVAMFRFKAGMIPTLAVSAIAGLVYFMMPRN